MKRCATVLLATKVGKGIEVSQNTHRRWRTFQSTWQNSRWCLIDKSISRKKFSRQMQYPPCKLRQCAAIPYLNDATNPTPHASLSSTRAAGTPWLDEYTACQSRAYENFMSLPYFFLHQQKTYPLPFSVLPIVSKSHRSVA